jgi:hypothetical protein
MRIQISEHCKCGGAFSISFVASKRNYATAEQRYSAFVEKHDNCITSQSDDAIEEPGGDVYASAERAQPHSEPELVTGFQRVVW